MLCRGSSGILIVDLTFHAQWHLLLVRRQLPCSDGYACLRSHPILANPTGATVWSRHSKLPTIGFSKLFWLFHPFEARSLHQRPLRKNYNFGTPASYHGQKVVLNRVRGCPDPKNDTVKLQVGTSFPEHSSFLSCKRRCVVLFLIWQFMVGGICFQFDASYHALMVLLGLEATLFLSIARVPLSRL